MPFLKKSWKWIKTNFKLILLIAAVILFFIFLLWLSSKNRKIRRLENELRILKAKIDLEKLAIRYDIEKEELKELKEKDLEIRYDLEKIEENLYEKLKEDMSAEEIIKHFRKIGL
jgi:hypothetical protein